MNGARLQRCASAVAGTLVLSSCAADERGDLAPAPAAESSTATVAPGPPTRHLGEVTLAFGGDVHFQLHLAALLRHPRHALGPISRTLTAADLAMVNLESAITTGGVPDAKELEVPADRFHFRTAPAGLDVLAEAGVDVVTMANNHAADYGPAGVSDSLRAIGRSSVAVVGFGADRRAAFAAQVTRVGRTEVAFLAADASFREGMSPVWSAGPHHAGVAAARSRRPATLLRAVRRADREQDVVVVYLHWGREHTACPTTSQRSLAAALARAGADVVVGSHTHTLQGSGWLGRTFVSYGLGNLLWYHDHSPETGVLRVRIRDGRAVQQSLVPARIQTFGRPLPVTGAERTRAIERWRRLRACSGLASRPGPPAPAFHATSSRIDPPARARMRTSLGPGCPVGWSELRRLRLSYIGFDGAAHHGELVVHRRYADDVVGVFRRLYAARWPIRRMRTVDRYGGSDRRSMAADNTSGFNCRRVAGRRTWSAHAYGAAIDVNPLENPDLSGTGVGPPAGRRFVGGRSTSPAPGVLLPGALVVRAFADIGWEWGGGWRGGPDLQHFAAETTATPAGEGTVPTRR